MKKIVIVDYGIGNLYSLNKGLRFLKAKPTLAQTPVAIRDADALILPGVGAFPTGMTALHERGLVSAIQEAAIDKKWILGICLGAQLLMTEGNEFRFTKGLGCVPGRVVKIPNLASGYRVPNINWNPVNCPVNSQTNVWTGTPLSEIAPGSQFYFVHSYICNLTDPHDILGETEYGGHTFCSIYKRDHIIGTQFHPEKSGETGLRFLKTFLDLI